MLRILKSGPRRIATAALTAAVAANFAPQALAASAAENAEFGQRVAFERIRADANYQQFIVHYHADAIESSDDSMVSRDLDRAARELRGANLTHVRKLATGQQLVGLVQASQRPNARQAEVVMMALARNPAVAYVEPDEIMQPLAWPNDSRFGDQWHYFEAAGGINLPPAWDLATGSGVTVAVIDTGITSHVDLASNIVTGYDFISNSGNSADGNGRDDDPTDPGDWTQLSDGGGGGCIGCTHPETLRPSSWHGTHVAGTIAAVTNNGRGVAGVAYNSKVSPIRVLGINGGTTSDIADAIVWAAGGTVAGVPANPNPAKVINMSLGAPNGCGVTYQTAIDFAVARGVVVVVSAGNTSSNAIAYQPASCANVIAVAATNRQGTLANYSNYGTPIDVAAPGGASNQAATNSVLSTANSGSQAASSGEFYGYKAGTSMAAPHVAGLAALILSKAPNSTPAQIEGLIKANARPFSSTCYGCGTGIVDAHKTLLAINTAVTPDAYENDDTRETFKALFEGSPQAHNFSESMDSDWVAFAVGEGTRSRVTLTGQVASSAMLRLYRQYGHPTGAIVYMGAVSNQAGQLLISNDAPFGSGQAVYYVQAQPTLASAFGANTQYSLAVTTEGLPDSYEADNTYSTFKALFAGSPHMHTFHQTSDVDWVAFAVDSGVTSQVRMTGSAANASSLQLYRDVNYPNTPVQLQLVSSVQNASNGVLSVSHIAPINGSISVYYAKVQPYNGSAAAIRSIYNLSVTTP